ncbi:hypothetical protein V8E51_012201 [Hyaloscypha variabilis]
MSWTGISRNFSIFQLSIFTAADLAKARHPAGLRRLDEVLLRFDAAHSGVGTGSCGPGVLEKY